MAASVVDVDGCRERGCAASRPGRDIHAINPGMFVRVLERDIEARVDGHFSAANIEKVNIVVKVLHLIYQNGSSRPVAHGKAIMTHALRDCAASWGRSSNVVP